MAVYSITAATVPANTGYPANLQGLLQLLESYLSVVSSSTLSSIVISSTTPVPSDNNKVWFQTNPANPGEPQSIRLFSNGSWQEFTPFSFGDIILTDVNSEISSPWGVGNTAYVVNGISKLTPVTPVPPTNGRYKVYVGYYE
jgi:hypothetical protein